MSHVLELQNYRVCIGERIILTGIDLALPDRGVVVLMGPGGAGKSTLIRSICGLNDSDAFTFIGAMNYLDAPLGEQGWPAAVTQKADLFQTTLHEVLAEKLPDRSLLSRREQRELFSRWLTAQEFADLAGALDKKLFEFPSGTRRLILVLAEVFADPPLLCLDEILVGLSDTALGRLLGLIKKQGLERCIFFVTHNQRYARDVADYCVLLAAGQLVEFTTRDKFFENPDSPHTRHYITTGGCLLPSPNASFDEISQDYLETYRDASLEITMDDIPFGALDDASTVPEENLIRVERPSDLNSPRSESVGPRGFRWMLEGKLGGAPKPGIVIPIEHDLEALARVGTTVLITLTAEAKLPPIDWELLGIEHIHFPIVDMEAPDLDRASAFLRDVEELLARDEVIVMHCKAGLGRTGTMLAAYLIWNGSSASDAINAARAVEPRWIQSRTQEEFLSLLEQNLQKASGETSEGGGLFTAPRNPR